MSFPDPSDPSSSADASGAARATAGAETPPPAVEQASERAARPTASQDRRSGFPGPVAEQDESSLKLVALRDVAVFAVLLTLFGAADTWARSSELGLAKLVALVDGLLIGAAVAGLLHEWGHFVGARLGGGHSPLKPIKSFPQVFDFDYAGNDARSFRWMSIGGNLGNWSAVLLFVWALPLGSVGCDAIVSGAVGFSVFTALVEFPVIRKARAGMPGLEALRTIPRDFVTRYLPYALGAALLTFLVL